MIELQDIWDLGGGAQASKETHLWRWGASRGPACAPALSSSMWKRNTPWTLVRRHWPLEGLQTWNPGGAAQDGKEILICADGHNMWPYKGVQWWLACGFTIHVMWSKSKEPTRPRWETGLIVHCWLEATNVREWQIWFPRHLSWTTADPCAIQIINILRVGGLLLQFQ